MGGGKSWLEVAGGRLGGNYRTLAEAACPIPVLAVIKADAYGHGAALCAPVLARAGAPWLGVADAAEGVEVRRSLEAAGISPERQPEILVMCGLLPEDAEGIVRERLTPVVWCEEQIGSLRRAAGPGPTVRVHLEIDTGMARQGVAPGAGLSDVLDHLASGAPGIELGGVMMHFSSAEVRGAAVTALERERFEVALGQIAERGLRPEWVHAGNSSTIDEGGSLPWLGEVARRAGARPLVRSGLALYGYCLPVEGGPSAVREGLQPALTWKSRIAAISDVPAGATVGYNASFVASGPMRLALLPIGYADGLRRELSSTSDRPGGWVMVEGQRAPIAGRISMNLTTVDVSGIAGAEAGSEVTVLGEGVSADDHARLAGTIAYEILCGLRAPARLID